VNVDDFYGKAAEKAAEVIEKSGLILVDDYRTLFCEGSVDEQRKEFLFAYAPSPMAKVHFNLVYYLLPTGLPFGGGYGTCRPTQEVYSRYNIDFDVRGSWVVGGFCDQNYGIEIFGNQSYYKRSELKILNGEAWDGDYCGTKFRQLATEGVHEEGYYGYFPFLRLADIYLLQAEAVAHTTGNEAGRAILKNIRMRAFDNTQPGDADVLQSSYRRTDFVQELLDERSRELCFEQQRKFDLVRFNRYESTIKSISMTFGVWNKQPITSVLIGNISDSQIWCPIPEEDEIANPELKPNNPGY
jgi:hypothetical protein